MALVTMAITVNGTPLRRVFMEHLGFFDVSLGWGITDDNGSITFDAGLGFTAIDASVHCRNSVTRVVDDTDPIPGTSHIKFKIHANNGDVLDLSSFRDHFDILARAQDVYDTVWRQFRPYNRSNRSAFPLGRKTEIKDTFAHSPTCELSYPDRFPIAQLAFVEPVGVFNNLFPIAHIKHRSLDGRLFGEGDAVAAAHDPSLLPHELGHVFHFAALSSATRTNLETSYIAWLTGQVATGGSPFHNFEIPTDPLVAWIEAAGIFSERFFFFAKLVAPTRSSSTLRNAFVEDELSGSPSLTALLVDGHPIAGSRGLPRLNLPDLARLGSARITDARSRARLNSRLAGLVANQITPAVTGSNVEGAVFGAVYLDFASRVGLREAVGLVLDSNATTFAEFQTHVHGRNRQDWTTAIDAVANTWGM